MENLNPLDIIEVKWVVDKRSNIERITNDLDGCYTFKSVEESALVKVGTDAHVCDVYVMNVITTVFAWDLLVKSYNLKFIEGYWM